MGLLDVERSYLVPCSDHKRSNLLSDESLHFRGEKIDLQSPICGYIDRVFEGCCMSSRWGLSRSKYHDEERDCPISLGHVGVR
jgi:hypothetical protein